MNLPTHAIAYALLVATAAATARTSARLHPAVRDAFNEDVKKQFKLVETDGSSAVCPKAIEHTTWEQDTSAGLVILPHNTIVQDGQRCESFGNEKRLEFYDSRNYTIDFKPIALAPPMPAGLLTVIENSGRNVDAIKANRAANSEFLIGFEGKPRFCREPPSLFPNLTTAFVMRPSNDFRIKGLDTALITDSIYLLMVPAYKGSYCLYSAADNPDPPTPDSPSTAIADADEQAALEPSAEADDVCFSADGRVTLRHGTVKRLRHVAVGDYVQTGAGVFSRVFALTHDDATRRGVFTRFETASGHSLTVTPGHFVYADGTARQARTVALGDYLHLGDGALSRVVDIRSVVLTGLFNPQTTDGNLVVDGVLATTFTSAVRPVLAHAALLPFRALYACVGFDALRSLLRLGIRRLVAFVPKGLSEGF